MKSYSKKEKCESEIFVGIDVHLKSWAVTVRDREKELLSTTMPSEPLVLKRTLARYKSHKITAVYEAGYFGYVLHDFLEKQGIKCKVVSPASIPTESSNRVKTDRKDSRKLAALLCKGMLRSIYVPSQEERYAREVIRTYHQLAEQKARVQAQIKSKLRFYGIDVSEMSRSWSKRYTTNLKKLKLSNRYLTESLRRYIELYEYLEEQKKEQVKMLKELSQEKEYSKKVELLQSTYGIGLIVAMEYLLELQEVSRFRKSKKLASYVGLTPSQHSSGEKVRMGRITKNGKKRLRGLLVESSWQLIRKDGAMRSKYEALKLRCGGKRAIVAIARNLLLRMRQMLKKQEPYVMGLLAG